METIDTKEFEVPRTTYSRDIETRVIQIIVLQALLSVEGVGLLEGNRFNSFFGRDLDRVKGIHVNQDSKNHQVNVTVEINVLYGLSIPEKAEEVQGIIVKEIIRLTGLHVASVHVIVKGLVFPKSEEERAAEDSYVKDDVELDELG